MDWPPRAPGACESGNISSPQACSGAERAPARQEGPAGWVGRAPGRGRQALLSLPPPACLCPHRASAIWSGHLRMRSRKRDCHGEHLLPNVQTRAASRAGLPCAAGVTPTGLPSLRFLLALPRRRPPASLLLCLLGSCALQAECKDRTYAERRIITLGFV